MYLDFALYNAALLEGNYPRLWANGMLYIAIGHWPLALGQVSVFLYDVSLVMFMIIIVDNMRTSSQPTYTTPHIHIHMAKFRSRCSLYHHPP